MTESGRNTYCDVLRTRDVEDKSLHDEHPGEEGPYGGKSDSDPDSCTPKKSWIESTTKEGVLERIVGLSEITNGQTRRLSVTPIEFLRNVVQGRNINTRINRLPSRKTQSLRELKKGVSGNKDMGTKKRRRLLKEL